MPIELFTKIIDLCLEEVMLKSNFSLTSINRGIMISYVCPVMTGQIEIQARIRDESNISIEVWCTEVNGIQSYVTTEITNLIDVLQTKKDKLMQKPASFK